MSQIHVFGVTITEPMTMATDYLITVAAFWFAALLLVPLASRIQLSRSGWGVAFIFIGLGALFGGTDHGFAAQLGTAWSALLWKGALYCVGLAMLFALVATVSGTVANRQWRMWLYAYSVVALTVYAWWMLDHDEFLYAVLNNVSTFIIISALQVAALVRYRAESAKWILSGVAVSFLSAGIQRSGFGLHTHFNHNDLYHIVQIAGLYLFYRGASLSKDIQQRQTS